MMPRYFIARRAKAWIADEDTWEVPLATVIPTVSDHKATDTGLLIPGFAFSFGVAWLSMELAR